MPSRKHGHKKTKQTNGWKPFLCAAPFFAVGENNCVAFFWGGFCFAAGFFFCVFFTKICLLIAFLHVCWSSFSATFLASCITFSASPYHVYKRIKRACKTHILSIFIRTHTCKINDLRQPSGGPPGGAPRLPRLVVRSARTTRLTPIVRPVQQYCSS